MDYQLGGPSPVLEQQSGNNGERKGSGGRKLIIFGVSLIILFSFIAAGYVYGSRKYDPTNVLGESLVGKTNFSYRHVEAALEIYGKKKNYSAIIDEAFEETESGGTPPPVKMDDYKITASAKSDIDSVKKATQTDLAFSFSGILGENTSSMELASLSLEDKMYLKLKSAPLALSMFISSLKDKWIVFDTSGNKESEQNATFSKLFSDIKGEEPEAGLKNLDKVKEELKKAFQDKSLYKAEQVPAWYEIVLKKKDLYYKYSVDSGQIGRAVDTVDEIIKHNNLNGSVMGYDAASLKLVRDQIENIELQIWLDAKERYIKKVFVSFKPKEKKEGDDMPAFDRLDILFSVAPLDKAPAISAPEESMSFEAALGSVLGGLGLGKTTAQELPKGVEYIDTDSDGLTDYEELSYGTDRTNKDTDDDGFIDGDEVKNGYNPNGPGKLLKKIDSFGSLEEARKKSRDAKRISDIKQIQTAFELYYNDIGHYPDFEEKGFPVINAGLGHESHSIATKGIIKKPKSTAFVEVTYMHTIYGDPSKATTGCKSDSSAACNYTFSSTDGNSYEMWFYLEGDVGDLKAGINCASERGIASGKCF